MMKTIPQTGFAIIEMMAVVLIASILMMVAIPSFQTFVINNRLTTEANLLVTAMQIARSEAVKRNNAVFVGSADGSGAWNNGYVVFLDTDNNGAYTAGTDTLIRREGSLTADTLAATRGGNPAPVFKYDPTGFASSLGAQPMTFDLCYQSGQTGRQITVDLTGQVSVNSSFTCP